MITPADLLEAYAQGYFPMAESVNDPQLYWFSPEVRGVIPLDGFRIPRSLKRFMKDMPFELRVNTDFEAVMRACAETGEAVGRSESWINQPIIALYCALHARGHAHSVEVWRNDADEERLVGGLYGVSLGGAFFGESMFSRESQASKVALVHLVSLLREAGYRLLDTQYVNTHLTQFGCVGIAKRTYLAQLEEALNVSLNPNNRFAMPDEARAAALSS